MNDDVTNNDDDVRILPPDFALQHKLGNANLDALLSAAVIQEAENVIARASDDFLQESVTDLQKLEQAAQNLRQTPREARRLLGDIIGASFAIKAKAGLGGYDLVSTIAKSLLTRCEALGDTVLQSNHMNLIDWHIASIKRLLELKVKGTGGPIGTAILAELDKLTVATNASQPPANS